jgi:chemotaxis protein MotB
VLFAGLAAPGCQNSPAAQGQLSKLKADFDQLAVQNRELQQRAATLDHDNQDHAKLLAQSQQQLRQRDDELAALREQLRDVTTQVAELATQKQDAEKQTEAVVAATRRGGGATIRANSTLKANVPQFATTDIQARADGDVIRIAILSDRLFAPGTAQLTTDAVGLIDLAGAEVARRFPDQTIGIEGHTDNDPVRSVSTGWSAAHQLTVQQAAAVMEQLVSRGRLRANQCFVTGHGGNYPIYSNAHPDGKARNRRIELVIYPERPGGTSS